MALHNDTDPLPKEREANTKKLTKTFQKIKPQILSIISKLANAIFLLRKCFFGIQRFSSALIASLKKAVMAFFDGARIYTPHLAVFIVASIAVSSNLVIKYAKADNTVSYPEPANEIALASTVDRYTPLLENDGNATDRAYNSTTDAFVTVNNVVDTSITQRSEPLPDNSKSSVAYIVKQGDTLTTLGWQFEVKISTLMYLNNIDNANLVQPGQKLTIPVRGYELSASEIAKKQKVKEAKLAADSSKKGSGKLAISNKAPTFVNHPVGNFKNSYPYGYCTYYVATRRYVPPSWGNAKSWPSSAKRDGYSVGSQPVVGSIGVTSESWWGHVTYVESVDGNMVTVAEMNAIGWGKVSKRTLSASAFRAFIY